MIPVLRLVIDPLFVNPVNYYRQLWISFIVWNVCSVQVCLDNMIMFNIRLLATHKSQPPIGKPCFFEEVLQEKRVLRKLLSRRLYKASDPIRC